MGIWKDIIGTTLNAFRLGITGNTIDTNAGRVRVRDSGNAAFAPIAASRMDVAGNDIVLQSEAANTYTLRRPASQSAPLTLTLPSNAGTAGQVISTDGAGNLNFVSAGNTADRVGVDTTTIAFGSTATVNLFTLPANAVVNCVRVIIDTAFNGTPSLSVGIAGSTSKYLASNQVSLTQPATTVFEIYPGLAPVGTTEALIASYSPGSATAGSARIEVYYCNPA